MWRTTEMLSERLSFVCFLPVQEPNVLPFPDVPTDCTDTVWLGQRHSRADPRTVNMWLIILGTRIHNINRRHRHHPHVHSFRLPKQEKLDVSLNIRFLSAELLILNVKRAIYIMIPHPADCIPVHCDDARLIMKFKSAKMS